MAHWILGFAIGIVIAMILVIIMHYTVFKKNPKMVWLYVLVILLFGFGGGAIQKTLHNNSDVPTPQEQIDRITRDVSAGWKNTNGGFTFDKILQAQEDENTPVYEDQVVSLKLHDFGSYIVFSYKDGDVYQNASFYKSTNGLILDGLMNVYYYNRKDMVWFWAYDLNGFVWKDGRNTEPIFIYYQTWGNYNLISNSAQNIDLFFLGEVTGRTNTKAAHKQAWKEAAHFTATNATDHFISFGNIELIGQAEEGYIAINTFYNYLYEQSKGSPYGSKVLIDANKSLCLPIPEALQQNYPIPELLQEEYGDAEYYGVYKCNIAVELELAKGKKGTQPWYTSKIKDKSTAQIQSTSKNAKYVNTLLNDSNRANQVTVEHIEPENNFAKVNLTFTQTQESDLTGLNLTNSPVTITFTSGTDSKTVRITSIEALNKVNTVLLGANKTWSYSISSNALLFDDFQGSFNLSTSGELEFEYYYLSGYVVASVGLNPVGTVNMAQVNLANYPVRIVLSNTTDTYQFVFNNNEQINQSQTQVIKLGTYRYTILSDQLTFASTEGYLTITTTDKNMLFNYAYFENEQIYEITATKTIDEPSNIGLVSFDGIDWEAIYAERENDHITPGFIYRFYSPFGDRLIDTVVEYNPNSGEGFYARGFRNGAGTVMGHSNLFSVLLQVSFELNGRVYNSNLIMIESGRDINIHFDVEI